MESSNEIFAGVISCQVTSVTNHCTISYPTSSILMAEKKAKVSLSSLITELQLQLDDLDLAASPLTPLTSESDTSMQDSIMSTQFWQRHASQGFLLPDELEGALAGPHSYPGIIQGSVISHQLLTAQCWCNHRITHIRNAQTREVIRWKKKTHSFYLSKYYQKLAPIF